MPLDEKHLLYSLANTFNTTLGIEICDDTKAYIKSNGKAFSKLNATDKMYYTKYAIQVAQDLTNYLKDISLFELNVDSDNEIVHDFRLTWKKGNIAHVSMSHGSINIRDVIPEKLMKICKYKKNTKIYKAFTAEYQKITSKAYEKIKSKNKYSELSDKNKNKLLLEPVCELVHTTLSKKRKCAVNLYNHLFTESNRIVLKLYKNRFTIYDFGKDLDDVESFRMKMADNNQILWSFNNGVKFTLQLQTNSSQIKEHISLKFHTNLKNMDDLFAVCNSTV